jgi:Mg2+ and Co2+ transporter CorA
MSLKASREKALEARIAELERELVEAKTAMQKALAVLLRASRGESVPQRDRKDYMREFMRRKRAATKGSS